jgi:hypothetical protein
MVLLVVIARHSSHVVTDIDLLLLKQ